jgi:hypothetical protein
LVFFGVPNLGLNQGKLKEITAGQLNEQLIRDLQVDDESEPTPYLEGLKAQFIHTCKNQDPAFKIISYFEQRQTRTAEVSQSSLHSRKNGY